MNYSDKVMIVTDSNYTSILHNKLVLIDFYADWCGPCKIMHSTINELSNEFYRKILICASNVDDNPIISAKYQIRSIPTIIIFRDGNVIHRDSGVQDRKTLSNIINNEINT